MKRKNLSFQERIDWLRLTRTEQVGPITFRQLLTRYASADDAIKALPELSRRGGRGKPLSPPPVPQIEEELRQIEKIGARLLCACEPEFPEALFNIEDCPPALTVLGDPSVLLKQQIGIVGARNASLNGRKMAEKLSRDLAQAGYIITSGLARGIDTAAHQAALPTGTVAATAGGVDVVYPEENRKLHEQIQETGCVISEQPMGCEPRANLFPKRNRLISGLSLGVVVVEAARQSGSLITARMALEQGREVFAVPGSPLDPRASGPNDLIRQGATLTEGAADVMAHLRRPTGLFGEGPKPPYEDLPMIVDERYLESVREKIIDFLSTSPVAVDELVRQCHVSLPHVLTVLLELELAGRLERQPGHKVVLIG